MLGLGQRGVPRSVAAIVAAASSPIGWHVLNGAATFTLTGFGYPQARVVGIIEQLGAGYPRIGRAARPGIGAGYPGICPALQTPAAASGTRNMGFPTIDNGRDGSSRSGGARDGRRTMIDQQ